MVADKNVLPYQWNVNYTWSHPVLDVYATSNTGWPVFVWLHVFLIIFWIVDNVHFKETLHTVATRLECKNIIYPKIFEKMKAGEVSFFLPCQLPQWQSRLISFCVLDGSNPFLQTELFGIIRFTSAALVLFVGWLWENTWADKAKTMTLPKHGCVVCLLLSIKRQGTANKERQEGKVGTLKRLTWQMLWLGRWLYACIQPALR